MLRSSFITLLPQFDVSLDRRKLQFIKENKSSFVSDFCTKFAYFFLHLIREMLNILFSTRSTKAFQVKDATRDAHKLGAK